MAINLYRIQSFDRVVQIFEERALYFAHPSSWDDPYETRLRHEASSALFAQCWCRSGVSDAMWRIYSPDRLGVRIRTTDVKLRAAIKEGLRGNGIKYRLRPVEYLKEAELNLKIEELADALKENFDPSRAADALQWKRRAFEHEKETRLIVFRQKSTPKGEAGIKIPIDPHDLIEDILIDPRAPVQFVKAYKLYFQSELKFKGTVSKSRLYSEKPPIEVTGESPTDATQGL